MKKFVLVMAAILGIAVVAAAQPRAIGIRAGYGAEVSYQHTLGGENFGELDLGWNTGAFSAGLAYDFMICPLGPLNFYAGPQVNVGFVNVEGVGLIVGAGAQIGIEYPFASIPLQLSLDWKPTFYFVPATAFGLYNVALGIRYLF